MSSIHNWAYDVEALPNFFSVTFVDLDDYLREFKDVCEVSVKKGKEVHTPIPLTEKLTVAEIKSRLNKIRKKKFYITDYDNSQHLPLLAFINNLAYNPTNKIYNWLYGFNTFSYDKLMIACFLMYSGICKTTKELCKKLYETSKQIISFQDDREAFNHDYYMQSLVKYNLPYKDIDVMRIFALNKVGAMTNAKGEKVYYGKSLKQTSINIIISEERKKAALRSNSISFSRETTPSNLTSVRLIPAIFARIFDSTSGSVFPATCMQIRCGKRSESISARSEAASSPKSMPKRKLPSTSTKSICSEKSGTNSPGVNCRISVPLKITRAGLSTLP